MKINPKKTALLVMDMQDCFCKPGGSLYCPRHVKMIKPMARFIEKMRKRGVQIIYTQDWHDKKDKGKHYRQSEKWGSHCVAGSKEAQILEELKPQKGDYIIKKKTYSGFYKTSLENYLKRNKFDTLLFSGVLTNVCIMHTSFDAAMRDYHVIVLSDLTEAITQKHKTYALDHIKWLYGDVIKSTSIK